MVSARLYLPKLSLYSAVVYRKSQEGYSLVRSVLAYVVGDSTKHVIQNSELFKMIVWVLTTCHTQYTSDSSICIFFYLTEQHSKFLLHTLQVLYMCTLCDSTGLFKMIVGVLTTCHTQYTSDSSIYVFLFNRTTLQVFVTYRTGALYVHPL